MSHLTGEAGGDPAAYRMIRSIEIDNFRCFRRLRIKDCGPINVIVGDSGSGKTALLEAIFLALCHNPQKALHLRQWRGNDAEFSGSTASIAEAFYGEFFYGLDSNQRAEIRLSGSGPEVRTLSISRGRPDVRMSRGKDSGEEITSPVDFTWTDAKGKKRTAHTRISNTGIMFEDTGETIPNFFFFAAQNRVPARETASRFSDLRKARKEREFVKVFTEVFDWIEDISVEAYAGSPVLHAAIRGTKQLLPLTAVSGGINRIAAILLAIAHRQKGIVLADEIEDGVFHTKQAAFARALLAFARNYQCQLFLTTHSQEWLVAFVQGAGKKLDDLSLWRIERGDGGPVVERFSGRTFKAGIDYGTEVRG